MDPYAIRATSQKSGHGGSGEFRQHDGDALKAAPRSDLPLGRFLVYRREL